MAWTQWYPTNRIYSWRTPLPLLIRYDYEKRICQEGCLVTESDNGPGQEAGQRWWFSVIKPLDNVF